MLFSKIRIKEKKMKYNLTACTVLTTVIFILACSSDHVGKDQFPVLTGEYLGQSPPGNTVELFAPGIISTREAERDACFSPDGKEFYYSMIGLTHFVILESQLKDGKWTRPEVAPFSGHYSDIEPFYSPDGRRIYFASNRPLEGEGEPKPDFDIWYLEKTGDGWSDAVNIGPPVNTERNEFYPSVTKNGNLYLTASYNGSIGFEDIYRSKFVEGKYTEPENLGKAINSEHYEYNAFVTPDESYLIYSAHGRQDGFGSGDLYVSFRQEDGSWSEARNMGNKINSITLDFCPYISPDGKYLFFSSTRKAGLPYSKMGITYDQMLEILAQPENGLGDIYWISADIIDEMR
jgi:hypothetical protein